MWTTRSTASARAAITTADRGTGVVGTLLGFSIFLILLLFAAQVMIRLYATSALTAAATRAAESVAQSPNPGQSTAAAEAAARNQLGTFGATRTHFTWKEVDGREIVLQVRGDTLTLLPVPTGWKAITRTVTVRTEAFR